MYALLCNQLCINLKQTIRPLVLWLAAWCGIPILPAGFQMFDPALAKQVGVERAAMYQKIKGWQNYNERLGKGSHYRRGRWWTYGRPEYWLESEFIWSSLSTVKRAFKDLEKAGLLLIDQAGGEYWISALSNEAVNLNGGATSLQLPLFTVNSDGSNRPSSIETLQKQKAKAKHPTTARPGIRKDAVADFHIPEHRDAIPEQRETREGQDEGHDMLRDLPGELVTAWADTKLSLETFVAAHGLDDVLNAWNQTSTYKNRVGGLRSRLTMKPSPTSAPPPSTGDEPTEPDWTEDIDRTPAIDVDNVDPDQVLSAEGIAAPCAAAWASAYAQLELQLDRTTFETYFKGSVQLTAIEGDVWRFTTRSAQQAHMLQHRLYREIKRLLPAGDLRFVEAVPA